MKTDINIIIQTDLGLVVVTSTIVRLLNNISLTGSITGAAKASDLSYKRAWDLLDNLNKFLPSPAISTSIGGTDGGGTRLTALGVTLVTTYNQMVSDAYVNIKDNLDVLRGFIDTPQV